MKDNPEPSPLYLMALNKFTESEENKIIIQEFIKARNEGKEYTIENDALRQALDMIESVISSYKRILRNKNNTKCIEYNRVLMDIAIEKLKQDPDYLNIINNLLQDNPDKTIQLIHYGVVDNDIIDIAIKDIKDNDNDKLLLKMLSSGILLFSMRYKDGDFTLYIYLNEKVEEPIDLPKTLDKCKIILENTEKLHDLYPSDDNIVEEIKNTILEYPDLINSKDRYVSTPLHYATENGNIEIVKVLVEKGAEVNAQDRYASTPLHNAASEGHINIVKFLLKKGADINTINEDGETPLDIARELGYMAIVKLLEEKQSDKPWTDKVKEGKENSQDIGR